MSSKGNHFALYMFQQDLDRMTRWVLQYPNKETGGDLFGLWSGEGDNAVIHVVLGPGRGCTHGDYHFYQDVDYLEKVGSLLTGNYMLGHIGEWHSHHQLQLDRPSDGDCKTIQRNFPQGSCGFFLMIANIIDGHEVQFSPYIFKEHSGRCRAGYVEKIDAKSPFSLIQDIFQSLEDGKEAEEVVAPRNELERQGHKQKSFFDAIKDNRMVKYILSFGEGPMESNESRKFSPKSSSPGISSSDTKVYYVKIPQNRSSQWYSKEENHKAITDIYLRLSECVGEIEITFDEYTTLQNMNMTFFYQNNEVSLIYPCRFPSSPARIKVNKRFLDFIRPQKCFTIQTFDSDEFVQLALKVLNDHLGRVKKVVS